VLVPVLGLVPVPALGLVLELELGLEPVLELGLELAGHKPLVVGPLVLRLSQ